MNLNARPWTCCQSLPDAAGQREENNYRVIMFGGRGDMDKWGHKHTETHMDVYTHTPLHMLTVGYTPWRAQTHTYSCVLTVSHTLIPCVHPQTTLNTLPVHTHPVVITHHYTHPVSHTHRHSHTIPWSHILTLCTHVRTHTQRGTNLMAYIYNACWTYVKCLAH